MSFAAYVSYAFCSVSLFIGIFVKSCCEQNLLTKLMKSRSAPGIINEMLQEMHLLLEALAIYFDEIVPELRAAGGKRWSMIITKRSILSQEVKKLELRACEYLNATVRRTIPPNVNVRKSANHVIQADCKNRVKQTRVLPYAGGIQFVTCAPTNGCFTGRKLVVPIMC